MKKWTPYLLVFTAPFLLMVLVNEYVGWRVGKSGYVTQGVEAIHSSERLKERCTWVCHNDTNWCKQHHVKFLSGHFALVDQVYFGIIRLLKGTGAYSTANIFFLVILTMDYNCVVFKALNTS